MTGSLTDLPALAPPGALVTPCEGDRTLVFRAVPPATGYRYAVCPGCVDCDRDAVRARNAARLATIDLLARIPTVEEDSSWL